MCNIEEKDFESPLYNELRFGSHRIATPGQVFEGKFGIDAAIEANNPLFWDIMGYPIVPEGVILNHYRWGFAWRHLGRRRILPTFKTNLLIQAKRSIYSSTKSTEYTVLGINGPYWWYAITSHQQKLLEKVSQVLQRKALVVYAAPVFRTFSELYDFTEKQFIVENTNFVKVDKLINHEKWIFNKPGSQGIAHSEPESIEDKNIFDLMESMRDQRSENPLRYSTKEDFEYLANLANSAFRICSELENNELAQYILRYLNRIKQSQEDFNNKGVYEFVIFREFCRLTGLKWLCF